MQTEPDPRPEPHTPAVGLADRDEPAETTRRLRDAAPAAKKPEVVAIGISTGGPAALAKVLPMLPADLAAPVLIVQHMPPLFTQSLADDLNRKCPLTVSEAVDGQPVSPGYVLIAPGGKQMKVVIEEEGEQPIIRITDDPPENSCRPSVDYLFRSVARVFGPASLGVIMTGMGYHGTLGCRLMKRQGATIIAQDEASCVVYGMPKEPTDAGIVDIVAPLEQIGGCITRRTGQGVAKCS